MKVSNTQTQPPPRADALPKQPPVQAQQKVQTPPQAAPQSPAHLGKSIDTKA